jgi:hypothetical protein
VNVPQPLLDENGRALGPSRVWLSNMMLPVRALYQCVQLMSEYGIADEIEPSPRRSSLQHDAAGTLCSLEVL